MRFLTCLALSFALTGCGLISFDVDQDFPEDTIPGSALGGLLPTLLTTPLTINLSDEEKQHDTGPVSSAHLSALRFTATPHDAPSGNFDFVDSIHVSIAQTNDASTTVEIAKLDPVPKGQTTIRLEPISGVDLLPFIKAGATINATATGHQPSQTFTYDGHITIKMKI